MKTGLERWKTNLEPWKTMKTGLEPWKTMKTDLEPWKTSFGENEKSAHGVIQLTFMTQNEKVLIFRHTLLDV